MVVDMAAIAVVVFNLGVFILLVQVLRVVFKLPRWLSKTQRFFTSRLAAVQPLQAVPQQLDRLNQLIFNSNHKLKLLSRRLSVTLQFTQLSGWMSRHRRR